MNRPVLPFKKIWKVPDYFDPDGLLNSIASKTRSNPTARRRRNYLEVFKNFREDSDGTFHTHSESGKVQEYIFEKQLRFQSYLKKVRLSWAN